MTKFSTRLKAENPSDRHPSKDPKPWQILVVDDEEEIHSITQLILKDLTFQGRSIHLLRAYSAAEARKVLLLYPEIALVLLDVVMETEHAGLELIDFIRDELKNKSMRIILRTGHPGQAPEAEVIFNYDINDYKSKNELTARKLVTAVVSSFRAFNTIRSLEITRAGLELIIDSSDSLFEFESAQKFASGVLQQLSAFLTSSPDGILCVRLEGIDRNIPLGEQFEDMRVIGSTGKLSLNSNLPLEQQDEAVAALHMAHKAIEKGHTIFQDDYAAIYLSAPNVPDAVAVLRGVQAIEDNDMTLLRYFSSKVSLALANVINFKRLKTTRDFETIDSITKLPSRHKFINLGKQVIQLSQQANQPLTLAIIKIDQVKQVKSTIGADNIDSLFQKLGIVLVDHIRDEDILARTGNEEFCLMLPKTDQPEAAAILQRLCAMVADESFTVAEHTLQFTISCGADMIEDTLESMMARAAYAIDQAGADAKQQIIFNHQPLDE